MRITANILTTLRFILAPIVMWLILADKTVAALSVYAVAIVTDILDGYLARSSKIIPSYGPTFDALADCSLFYLPIIALAIAGRGFWLLVGATVSVAYLVPVLGIIRKNKGGLAIPRLDTGLLAASVHVTSHRAHSRLGVCPVSGAAVVSGGAHVRIPVPGVCPERLRANGVLKPTNTVYVLTVSI